MRYKKDHKLIQAYDLFKFLTKEIDDEPISIRNLSDQDKINLLIYLIQNKNETIDKLKNKNKEYDDVFRAIGKFIPNNSRTLGKIK